MPAPDNQAMIDMLASLWQRTLPATQEKLAVLDRAAAAAVAGTLSVELCREAGGEAHKLAGSLGMFGYAKGTDLARSIEQHLDSCKEMSAVDAVFVSETVKALRAELGL